MLPFVPFPTTAFWVSVTISENVNVPAVAGAVNVGCGAVALESVTAGPPVCVHA